MVDSYGDGWNGASFTIDGQSFGLTSGANATETFCLGVVAGCTDPAASNYDATATTDDGSCVYPCLDNEVAFVMIDSYGDGWNGATYEIFDDAGVSIANGGLSSGASATDTLCIADGCYSIAVGGGSYDSEVSFDFGSLVGAPAGTYDNIVVGAGSCGQILVVQIQMLTTMILQLPMMMVRVRTVQHYLLQLLLLMQTQECQTVFMP